MMRLLKRAALKEEIRAEQAKASSDIVTRFARGNTSVQNGQYLDETALLEMSCAADMAISRLKKRIPTAIG